jgi:hypothetical protein
MVNMNLGKKARNTASITNNTCIYGSMGGTPSSVGNNSNMAVYRAIQTRGGKGIPFPYQNCGPKTIDYLKRNNLLSINPAGSGGVGRMFMTYN